MKKPGRIRGWENTYFEWMYNIKDWCISRQIWWGHQIPAWYCGNCQGVTVSRTETAVCRHCGSAEIRQDEDVLDTWFSSALWPFSTLGWPKETEDLKRFYPTSVLVTGFDILFFWVARMIMMGLKFMGDVPFGQVYIHALVRDAEGQKMSKSRGNVIEPLEVIDKGGGDAFRFPLAALAGRWILSRLQEVVGSVTEALEAFRFNEGASVLYQFVWHEYCDWYLEMAKRRLTEGEGPGAGAARAVLAHVLETVLRLLHPIMPFITEEIWQRLPHEGATIMRAPWPVPDRALSDPEATAALELVMDLVRA